MRHLIIGTAGHIDHGKSSLVRALTGVDPDRLPEEKARGMTIVLGFAPLSVGQTRFGVVDVPGHERFVRTMVAGATSIDLALLVVAADDGVMPQTVEHVEILDLLGVSRGVVAINKLDLVGQPRFAEVCDQVRRLLHGTGLAHAPLVGVSANTGAGLDKLRDEIVAVAAGMPPRVVRPIFRLAIDRVFVVKGRGTVVTGSVLSGAVTAGDTLELMPAGLTCRVRELQTHFESADSLSAGQRAALNLVGVDKTQITPGHELATPGYLTPTRCMDARLRLLSRSVSPMKAYTRVRLGMGTEEDLAVVVTAGRQPLAPGQTGYVQLRLRSARVAAHGQRFILRDEIASRTMGGGVILRPVSTRAAPGDATWVHALSALESGSPEDRLQAVLALAGFAGQSNLKLACQTGVDPDQIAELSGRLEARGCTVRLPGLERPVHAQIIERLAERTQRRLARFHELHPLQPGMAADALITWLARRSDKGLGRVLFDEFVRRGCVVQRGTYVCHASFAPALSEPEQRLYDAMVSELRESAFSPPSLEDLRCARGQNVQRLRRLAELAKSRGHLVQIDSSILLHADRLAELRAAVSALIEGEGPATVSQIRQRLGTSRKYVVPIVEYLDRNGFTRREGDLRSLVRHSP